MRRNFRVFAVLAAVAACATACSNPRPRVPVVAADDDICQEQNGCNDAQFAGVDADVNIVPTPDTATTDVSAPLPCSDGCDDANPCTDDSCDPLGQCVHLPNSVTCDDGDPCTKTDACTASGCVGKPIAWTLDVGDGAGWVNNAVQMTSGGWRITSGLHQLWAISTSGQIQWHTEFVGPQNTVALSADLVATQNGLALVTFTLGQPADKDDETLHFLDALGTVTKSIPLTAGNLGYPPYLTVADDDSVILSYIGCLSSGGSCLGTKLLEVRRIDSNAAVIDTYVDMPNIVQDGSIVAKLSNGALLVLLGLPIGSNPLPPSYFTQPYGLGIVSGELSSFASWPAIVVGGLPTVDLFSDDAICLALAATDAAALRPSLTRFAAGGNALWHIDLPWGATELYKIHQDDNKSNLNWQNTRVLAQANGDTIVLGPAFVDGADRPALWRVDQNGALRWRRALPVFDYAILVRGLNDFVIAGSRYASDSDPGLPLRVIHMDPFGNGTCAESGPCASKTPTDCDDNDSCTNDLCDAAHNGCWHEPFAEATPCKPGKTCVKGVCQAGK